MSKKKITYLCFSVYWGTKPGRMVESQYLGKLMGVYYVSHISQIPQYKKL